MKKFQDKWLARVVFFLAVLLFFLPGVFSVEPFGASITSSNSQRANADSPSSVPAQAGNVTAVMISGYSITQSWQGYFGNVTGTIQLADASDNVLYNWTLASPQGEIYASMNNTIGWTNIQCFNFTANGSHGSLGTPGDTNLAGINLTVLESRFNINSDDVDGVNETFTLQDHDLFYTSNLQFSANECKSARMFGSTGQGQDGQFEEVLLYEPTTGSVVFASILEQNALGFDNGSHDFEMIVLEDGHGTDTLTSTYYFYVELE